jgi:hypothetical protein
VTPDLRHVRRGPKRALQQQCRELPSHPGKPPGTGHISSMPPAGTQCSHVAQASKFGDPGFVQPETEMSATSQAAETR